MSLPTISPAEARRRLAEGSAILVDIREPLEHAREAIPGVRHAPLSRFETAVPEMAANGPAVIFHCQSGKRTADNAARLASCKASQAFILEGGLSGWKAAGLPTRLDRGKPIELQRQVQIAAGVLVLAGVTLSFLVSPVFAALTALVGGGLIFAGATGWCGMAKFLGAMPWNRAA